MMNGYHAVGMRCRCTQR